MLQESMLSMLTYEAADKSNVDAAMPTAMDALMARPSLGMDIFRLDRTQVDNSAGARPPAFFCGFQLTPVPAGQACVRCTGCSKYAPCTHEKDVQRAIWPGRAMAAKRPAIRGEFWNEAHAHTHSWGRNGQAELEQQLQLFEANPPAYKFAAPPAEQSAAEALALAEVVEAVARNFGLSLPKSLADILTEMEGGREPPVSPLSGSVATTIDELYAEEQAEVAAASLAAATAAEAAEVAEAASSSSPSVPVASVRKAAREVAKATDLNAGSSASAPTDVSKPNIFAVLACKKCCVASRSRKVYTRPGSRPVAPSAAAVGRR
jgi:hypothetical protein